MTRPREDRHVRVVVFPLVIAVLRRGAIERLLFRASTGSNQIDPWDDRTTRVGREWP